jgi:hypothetical protein
VLAGKAAARLIRVESALNATICAEARKGEYYSPLSNAEWQTHSVHVVPLLPEDTLNDIAGTYLAVHMMQEKIIAEVQNRADDYGVRGKSLEECAQDFDKVRYWMFRIEKKHRFELLVELLLGRPKFPSGEDIDRALADMESGPPKGRS